MSTAAPAASATPNSVPLDAEAQALQLQQAKAQARQAIAEAQKATLAAELPTSTVTAPTGTVTVGQDVGLIGQLLAYKVVCNEADSIAARITRDLKTTDTLSGKRLLIVQDRGLGASDWAYSSVRHQLDQQASTLLDLKTKLTQALPSTDVDSAPRPARAEGDLRSRFFPLVVPGALTAVPAVIGAAAGIVGMFSTDYSITSTAVMVGSDSLVAALTSSLLKEVTPSGEVVVDGYSLLSKSRIIADFWQAADARADVGKLATQLQVLELDTADQKLSDQRDELKNAQSTLDSALAGGKSANDVAALTARITALSAELDALPDQSAQPRALVTAANAATQTFDTFAAACTTGSPTPLLAAALRERLQDSDASQCDGERSFTHVLFVSVEGTSAETITQRKLFGGSGDVGFIGGAVVSYLLFDVAVQKVTSAGNFVKLGRIRYRLESGVTDAESYKSL